MLLPMPLSQFVHIEIQYRSLSVKRMQQDGTGLGLSVAELLQAMGRGISGDGCVSTRIIQCSDVMGSQLFLEISESFVLCWGAQPGFLCTQQLSQWFG